MSFFKHIMETYQTLSKERLEICHTCEKYDKDRGKCLKCGCFMKFKTFIPDQECPLGKWKPHKVS